LNRFACGFPVYSFAVRLRKSSRLDGVHMLVVDDTPNVLQV